MNANEFRILALEHFKFLVRDFNCESKLPTVPEDVPTRLAGYEVFFNNASTGVSVALEVIEMLPTVHLHRLSNSVNGRDVYPLGLLLLLRAPELNPLKDETGLPLRKDVETLLKEYAQGLKIAGADVLRGDFTIFPALEAEWTRQLELRTSLGSSKFIYF